MNQPLIDIFIAIVILPSMSGNICKIQRGFRIYDCSKSIMVIAIFLFAIVIVSTITIGKQYKSILYSFLTVVVIVGILSCVFIWILVRKQRTIPTTSFDLHTRKVEIIFLWMFGILSTISCVFKILKHWQCAKETSVSQTFYIVILVIFFVTELVLLSTYRRYKIQCSIIMNSAMQILIAADISVWFHLFIHGNEGITTNTDTNSSLMLNNNCLKNSTIIKRYSTLQSILHPAFLEFAFLSVTIIPEIWIPFQNKVNESKQEDISESEEHYSEMTPLSNSNRHNDVSRRRIRSFTPFLHYIVLFGSIAVCVTFFVGYVVQATVLESQALMYALHYLNIAVKTVLLITIYMCFFGTIKKRNTNSQRKSFGIKEYIFLLSSLGMFMNHIYKVLRTYSTLNEKTDAKIVFTWNIMGMFHDYLQTVFVLQEGEVRKVSVAKKRKQIYAISCLLLTIGNFGSWFSESFIFAAFPTSRSMEQKSFGDMNWTFFNEFILPLKAYYRFSSAFVFYSIYKQINI